MIGTTISCYRVLGKLGAGGRGVVYKAQDVRLGRFVALKFLPDEFLNNRQLRERFQREARAASTLNHPNICTIYDIGEGDGHVFMAMEFLDGTTLKDLVLPDLPLDRLVDISTQVLEGLEAAHAQNVIHRDIKPANIFITSTGRVKILDFGLAKISAPSHARVEAGSMETIGSGEYMTTGGGALGTMPYMSPEQALGKPIDARSDLFSFGVTLYEMATGKMPFQGDTTGILFLSTVQDIRVPAVQLNPDIPDELQRIIGKCLEKDRELRYQHASDIITDLKRLKRESTTDGLTSGAFDSSIGAPSGPVSQTQPGGPFRTPPPSNAATEPVQEIDSMAGRGSARRTWIAAAVAAALLIASGIAVVRYGNSHKSAALSEKDSIILADFTNTTGDEAFDDTLKQALAIDLEQSPFLNVISDRRVASTLKEMSRPANERMRSEIAREVCLRTNSKVFVAGSIARVGDHYFIGLKALNCDNGDVVASAGTEAQDKNSLLKSLDNAGNQVRRKLGESLSSVERFNTPLVEASTSSLDALRAYSLGKRALIEQGDPGAIPFYKRAVEIDPNFALAHASLGVMYDNAHEETQAIRHFKRAFDLRERVSENERFYIEAVYYGNATGELDKANQTYTDWAEVYPRNIAARINLGLNYMRLGDWDKALQETQEALGLNPVVPATNNNLVAIYGCLNRLDEAKAAFDFARSQKIDGRDLRHGRYIVAFLQGDMAGMQAQINEARGQPGVEDLLLSAEADTQAYYGHFGTSREFTRRAVISAKGADAPEAAGDWAGEQALRDAEAGDTTLAKAEAMRVLAAGLGRDEQALAALALARAGDTAQAQKLADNLDQRFPLDTLMQRYTLPTIRAGVALDQNDPRKAIEILEVAMPYEQGGESFGWYYPAYLRGLAYLEARQGQRAAAEFQKMLDHPGVVGNFVTGTLAHLQLARAEAMSGNREAARRDCQEFLALWKDADPDLPVLKQAKAEYARLS